MVRGLGVLLCCGAAGSTCLAGQSFRFEAVAPQRITAVSGFGAEFTVEVVLRSASSDPLAIEGATGWSLSAVVRGALVVVGSLDGITVSTVFDDDGDPATPPIGPREVSLADAPVSSIGLGSGSYPGSPVPGELGVVSAVALHRDRRVALPANGRETIARFTLHRVAVREGCSSVEVEFIDGLRDTGDPVRNLVDYAGSSVPPELGPTTVEVCGVRPDFHYHVVPDGIATRETPEGDLLAQPEVALLAGEPPHLEFDAFVVLASDTHFSDGPQAWSVAVGHSECLELLNATLQDVVVDTLFDHDNEPATPLIDAPLDLSQAGCRIAKSTEGGGVSAVVLNTLQKRVLRSTSVNKVLKLRYRYLPAIGE
ncbi:MAG: hypothetical protein ACRD2T_02825, partial [Thermoanaerobaculia bacterium]